ncbi:ABC transporter substrate-binding protein [Amycolatopsis samaneae]|uniref:ABC transporter substrate-binding protein n=1 Tax=Amycolatopsis samaneae TaxID=664691 RepID=A0ABW5GT40_9PSEU
MGLVLALAGLLASACTAGPGADRVSVIASWTGSEGEAFGKVLRAFKDETGIQVDYQGTRAVDQVLASDVRRGTAPDVAVLPNPGSLAAHIRQGQVRPLDDVLGEQARGSFGRQWQNLLKLGTANLYAVPVKADVKSVIWYNRASLPGPAPRSLAELGALSTSLIAAGATPWCLGMGAPPTSGWPGTDWIEDILLHTAGPEAYRQWSAGTLPWTSAPVREAWKAWGNLVTVPGAVRGGTAAALLTDFGDAGKGLFTTPQGCALEHQLSFIMGPYQAVRRPDGGGPRPGADFDFFRFPGANVSEVSADLAGMFHDTPAARRLMVFLTSDKAQRIWPGIPGGSTFSASRTVDPGVYGDAVSRKVAATLTSDPQQCFDASDLMPATMTGAFYRAVLEYLNDPGQLETLLSRLENVRGGIPPGEWLDVPCGQ